MLHKGSSSLVLFSNSSHQQSARDLATKRCPRRTSTFPKGLCKICTLTIPRHPFFGTRLPRSSVLRVLVLASEGTAYLWSRSAFFLPQLTQQFSAPSSSRLCPFRLNPLSLPSYSKPHFGVGTSPPQNAQQCPGYTSVSFFVRGEQWYLPTFSKHFDMYERILIWSTDTFKCKIFIINAKMKTRRLNLFLLVWII